MRRELQEIFKRLNELKMFRGYVTVKKDKTPTMKFNVPDSDLFTLKQVEALPHFAGVLEKSVVLVDIDDTNQYKILLNIIDKIGVNCRVHETTRGGHFFFRNSGIKKQSLNGVDLPIGLKADVKTGPNQYAVLRVEEKDRKLVNDCEKLDELPFWLLPLTIKDKCPDFINMREGDGRNDTLFTYQKTLIKNNFDKNQCREISKIINEYLFEDQLSEEELSSILRDETYMNVKSKGRSDFPHLDENGKPLKVWENTQFLLNSKLGMTPQFNQITKKTGFNYEQYETLSDDAVLIDLHSKITIKGFKLSKNELEGHILRIAEENAFNPVRDYLNGCLDKWDGKAGRIKEFFKVFELTSEAKQYADFLYTLFVKWLVTTALLAFNDGTIAAQGVLILCGRQGIGKSRFLNKLLSNHKWGLSGAMIDPNNKDSSRIALSYWIVELGEFARTLSAKTQNHYKNFVTQPKDCDRIPFARYPHDLPRRTAFYASTDDNMFLKEDSGQRRFWTIAINDINDDVTIDLEQLWGEITDLALVKKYPHWLNNEEIDKLNLMNQAFVNRESEYNMLLESFDWGANKNYYFDLTPTDLCNIFEINSATYSGKIGKALKSLITADYDIIPPSNPHKNNKYKCPPFNDRLLNEKALRFAKSSSKEFWKDDGTKIRLSVNEKMSELSVAA